MKPRKPPAKPKRKGKQKPLQRIRANARKYSARGHR